MLNSACAGRPADDDRLGRMRAAWRSAGAAVALLAVDAAAATGDLAQLFAGRRVALEPSALPARRPWADDGVGGAGGGARKPMSAFLRSGSGHHDRRAGPRLAAAAR
jgi:hypothetical protein